MKNNAPLLSFGFLFVLSIGGCTDPSTVSDAQIRQQETTLNQITDEIESNSRSGDIITFEFEGVVNKSNKTSAFPIGQPVRGRYSFDSTDTFDSNPENKEQGIYDNIVLVTFSSGRYIAINYSSLTAEPDHYDWSENIRVNRNTQFEPRRYSVNSICWNTPDEKCGLSAEGDELRRITLTLADDQGEEIETIDLPLDPPDINNFNFHQLALTFDSDYVLDPGVIFNITSLTKL